MATETKDMPVPLERVRSWFVESRDLRIPHERARRMCHDYFENKQLSDAMVRALIARGQAPVVINEIRPTVNVLTGLFRTQKLDWQCEPVGPEDEPAAEIKQHLLKHFLDASQLDYAEPEVADDMAIGGKGWIFVEPGVSGYGLRCRRLSAETVYLDPFCRAYDINEDARFVHVAKWLEVERAALMYPKKAEELKAMAVGRSMLDRDDGKTRVEGDDPYELAAWQANGFELDDFVNRDRQWLRIVETWYRVDEMARFFCLGAREDEITQDFQFTDAHVQALMMGRAKIKERLTKRMRRMIWCGPLMIEDGKGPHDVDRFPLVRWAGYLTQDGDAQGIVHDLLDLQDIINKSWSRATWHRTANQLWHEPGAFPQGVQHARDQVNRPDGNIEVTDLDKAKVDRGSEAIAQETAAIQYATDRIHTVSGVNQSMRGENGPETSRVAIDAKREQAYLMQGVLFDHRVRSWVLLGELLLAMAAQYVPADYAFQVTSEDGTKSWVTVNKRVVGDDGVEYLENSIEEGRVNVKVTDAPLSDTERERLQEMLIKAIELLPPEQAGLLAHLPIMVSRLPQQYKAEFRAVADAYKKLVMGPLEQQQAMADQQAQMGGGDPMAGQMDPAQQAPQQMAQQMPQMPAGSLGEMVMGGGMAA